MQDPVGSEIIRVGPTHYTNQRKVLTVRASDCVDDAESSHSERDDTRADALAPRVAVGGVPCVELITASYVGELWFGDEVVEEGEVKVTGDGEDVGDPDLDESACEVAAERGFGGRDGGGWDGVFDG